MPDSFEHTPPLAMRMPNGALASLAGNVDNHHRVFVADLILAQRSVPETITQLMTERQPDLVGLSVMTFQRKTAFKIVSLVKRLRPSAKVVVGGYDPSLAPDAYRCDTGIDFIVHGEGDLTFRELVRAVEHGGGYESIAGLSYRCDGRFTRNPPRAVSHLGEDIKPPKRSARVLDGYTLLGRKVDIVETSRGCTYDCSFCSIIEMRGRNFHTWGLDRVIADISDAKSRGARAVFLVDDNITLNVARFKALCDAITSAGLNDIDYIVQGMTSAFASSGDDLGKSMRDAGFRYVFLGIENVLEQDLTFLKASAKNARREGGRTVGSATQRAVDIIHKYGMLVVGGLIVGNPGDTREAIETNLAFARKFVDWPYIQHPTPYPGTPMTKDFRERDLIVSDDEQEYDGTTAVVRSEHLDAREIEFLRWRAERWIKVRHMPSAIAHDPMFVLKNGFKMLGHTFRGSTWKSVLGLESEREVFERYRAIRRAEREFFPIHSA